MTNGVSLSPTPTLCTAMRMSSPATSDMPRTYSAGGMYTVSDGEVGKADVSSGRVLSSSVDAGTR